VASTAITGQNVLFCRSNAARAASPAGPGGRKWEAPWPSLLIPKSNYLSSPSSQAAARIARRNSPAGRGASASKSNQTGLPDSLKSGVENLSGLSLDDVKIYYNSARPASLNALAYAQGTDIHVAPGQEQHLPHEA
jgi:hypothetical protein